MKLDKTLTTIFLVSSFLIVAPASAQTDMVLDEIVVTATKRTASLQDVGVSVAAFSGDDLERLNVKDSDELLVKVPNLLIQSNAGSTNANIFLRGVGSTGVSFNLQSGVGVYSDEVALNSPLTSCRPSI